MEKSIAERTFGILKGRRLTKALEKSRRKEKEHENRNIKHRFSEGQAS